MNKNSSSKMDVKEFSKCMMIVFVLLAGIKFNACAIFEKIESPLHTDLENGFITAHWTHTEMYCALKCEADQECKSFLYTHTGKCYSCLVRIYLFSQPNGTFLGITYHLCIKKILNALFPKCFFL